MMRYVFKKGFRCLDHKRFAIAEIADRSLNELYDIFKNVCENVHTDKENTGVHFLLKESDSHIHTFYPLRRKEQRIDLLWTCSHFEGTSVEAISGLSYFVIQMRGLLGHDVHVELLDGVWEKLLIEVYDVDFNFPDTPIDVFNKGVDYGGEVFTCPHCGQEARKVTGTCEWEGKVSWCSKCGRTVDTDKAPKEDT